MSISISAIFIERFPPQLEPETLYVSERFQMGTLLCPCGCGHQVNLLLGDGHTYIIDKNGPTIKPSIGVWDSPCKSHFFLNDGEVIWLESWSDDLIHIAMTHQQKRHIAKGRSPSRHKRAAQFLKRLFGIK